MLFDAFANNVFSIFERYRGILVSRSRTLPVSWNPLNFSTTIDGDSSAGRMFEENNSP